MTAMQNKKPKIERCDMDAKTNDLDVMEEQIDELVVLEQMVTNMQVLENDEARARLLNYLKSRFDV